MIFNTYGSIDNPHIMLIHGAGYGWWNFINYIDTLSKSYYVIIPTLDGHSEDSQTQYISTELYFIHSQNLQKYQKLLLNTAII